MQEWTFWIIVIGCVVFAGCTIALIGPVIRKITLRRISNELTELKRKRRALRHARISAKRRIDMSVALYQKLPVKIFGLENDGLLTEMSEDRLKIMSGEMAQFHQLNEEIAKVEQRLHVIRLKHPHLFPIDQGEWNDEDTPVSTNRTPPPALH